MSERMKILIGHDGSDCANHALEDVKRAGLPAVSEVFVLSAADVLLPPPLKEGQDVFPLYVPPGVRRAHEHAARAVEDTRSLAEGQRSPPRLGARRLHVRQGRPA